MSIKPYLELMRIDKPGWQLVLWPMAWGLGMAAYSHNTPFDQVKTLSIKAIVSANLIHWSCCTINDIFDRDLDAAVERTKTRPIPSGRVTVLFAFTFVLVQYVVGTMILRAMYPSKTVLGLVMIEFIPAFFIYPLVKRVSHWPQAWLAFALNIGHHGGCWFIIALVAFHLLVELIIKG
ncbi:hypothetical protein EIP91_010490 [Steccherinum ochraceum]|uniref:Uncharacterized protein n=1 Tax=Steccherinum ochraceum TaxID=92696 RepID=A0A4R0RQS8_9APHY|nr:hypothetical protein EIP91_010490 [Steccherinum ochraceum]